MLLSLIVLTKNEQANLPHCLASLEKLGAEVFVVDSGSSDRTVEIAKQLGCQVFEHPFENHAAQINWALQNLPIKTPWIMRLDADERLTPELVEELKQILPYTDEKITGYQVKRRVFFMGRWIRHGGYYPTWLLRIWRTDFGVCEQRWMDEHIVLKQGKIAKFQHDIIDENKKGLSFWIDKHNRYADREVKDMVSLVAEKEDDLLKSSQYSQAIGRRWIKKNLYTRSPLFLRAFLYFLMRYIIGLGFLDGLEGLIFHFLQGFWYRFLVDAKIYELQKKEVSSG
ncbi:glycosyltransferase family 2 protein [Funiculus sociatus GB2-A5]|uniref:Glycosyltransferase family 2 protein n=1 Tax=Funiculus sociatus GB2-A5 TaxID=2933946 RepID=A0ABV0JQH3_9CYAN|nr:MULTISPECIES: glycosyltransferase family 2 protein [unclassified Trichocoleus]MBD1905400.1 glycosyltransferase family 2 protein [Trichocoleus sp. FACHB-832]MBD2061880.1 glycosyltransferase family 2 protein [Trichocoleus sp. FACHB-6]